MAGDINHLGSCARATTINNEDLVLTTSDGVRLKISKGDLAKAMREAFPAATNIGNEDKIPIIQGGVDKTATLQVLTNQIYRAPMFNLAPGASTTIDLPYSYQQQYMVWVPSIGLECTIFTFIDNTIILSVDKMVHLNFCNTGGEKSGKINVVINKGSTNVTFCNNRETSASILIKPL